MLSSQLGGVFSPLILLVLCLIQTKRNKNFLFNFSLTRVFSCVCVCVCVCVKFTQLCPTLSDPMDYRVQEYWSG